MLAVSNHFIAALGAFARPFVFPALHPADNWEIVEGTDTVDRPLDRIPAEADSPGRRVDRGHREVALVGRADKADSFGKADTAGMIEVAVVETVVL